jgi:hypothetical protein
VETYLDNAQTNLRITLRLPPHAPSVPTHSQEHMTHLFIKPNTAQPTPSQTPLHHKINSERTRNFIPLNTRSFLHQLSQYVSYHVWCDLREEESVGCGSAG